MSFTWEGRMRVIGMEWDLRALIQCDWEGSGECDRPESDGTVAAWGAEKVQTRRAKRAMKYGEESRQV